MLWNWFVAVACLMLGSYIVADANVKHFNRSIFEPHPAPAQRHVGRLIVLFGAAMVVVALPDSWREINLMHLCQLPGAIFTSVGAYEYRRGQERWAQGTALGWFFGLAGLYNVFASPFVFPQ